MAKSSVKSVTLFDVLGRLFSVFAASVNSWKILTAHVKSFTLKRLSETRRKAKIASVKAFRCQIVDVRVALSTIADREERHHPAITHEAVVLSQQLKDFGFHFH
jgi:hypothetical protein